MWGVLTEKEGTTVFLSSFGFMFKLAEDQGKTVAHLLTGQDAPLSNLELEFYKTYLRVKQRINQQANK